MARKFLKILVTYLALTSLCYAAGLQLDTEVRGIQGPVLENIQQRLAIARQAYGEISSTKTIETYYNGAERNIEQAMEPYGYFKPHIEGHLVHQNNRYVAIFIIHPGPQLLIHSIEINVAGPGESNPAIRKLVKKFPLKSRQVFQSESYDRAKEKLFQVANEQGYLKATLERKEIRIDLEKYRADIYFTLETGPRFYFGKVRFNQQTFSESFLERFMSFKEGEPFSSEKLLKFQQNLNSSNYFRDVSVAPQMSDSQTTIVPIDVSLTPNKSQQYNIGFGYGTFTGPRLTLGANFRHMTPTGHHLDMQLKLSPVLTGLATQYIIPGENPNTDQYSIGANLQKFAPKNGKSISGTLSLGAIKQFNDWKRTLTISYLGERYNVTGEPFRNSALLIPSAEVSYVKADNLLFTRRGRKFDIVVRGAAKDALSTTNFIQTEIKGKYIISPTEYSRLIIGGDFGYTVVRNLDTLPLSLAFFAGGMDSVRGFPYSYFGPGRYLKVGSIELQHRLYGKLSGAIFYDVGTADNHLNAPMGNGRGAGLIYDSFVGPIKMYVGFGKLQNKPRRFDFEFSIGPDL